jgi:hypothetical protein
MAIGLIRSETPAGPKDNRSRLSRDIRASCVRSREVAVANRLPGWKKASSPSVCPLPIVTAGACSFDDNVDRTHFDDDDGVGILVNIINVLTRQKNRLLGDS